MISSLHDLCWVRGWKRNWKSVNVYQSCGQLSRRSFLWNTVYTPLQPTFVLAVYWTTILPSSASAGRLLNASKSENRAVTPTRASHVSWWGTLETIWWKTDRFSRSIDSINRFNRFHQSNQSIQSMLLFQEQAQNLEAVRETLYLYGRIESFWCYV